AVGISSWIGIQTFVNIGGATGLIPLTGVTLPLMSFGGVSLLMVSTALGILMNISINQNSKRKKKA
ncbi:MAG TPA: FtsW/RodA/SpoVE family cell cycle protein, partial [Solibacillus sp.]